MIHQLNQSSAATMQLTWQSIGWRLVLTALLLLLLAGSGVTIFNPVMTQTDMRVLPPLSQGAEAETQESGIEQQPLPTP